MLVCFHSFLLQEEVVMAEQCCPAGSLQILPSFWGVPGRHYPQPREAGGSRRRKENVAPPPHLLPIGSTWDRHSPGLRAAQDFPALHSHACLPYPPEQRQSSVSTPQEGGNSILCSCHGKGNLCYDLQLKNNRTHRKPPPLILESSPSHMEEGNP